MTSRLTLSGLLSQITPRDGAAPADAITTAVTRASRARDTDALVDLAKRRDLPDAAVDLLRNNSTIPVRVALLTNWSVSDTVRRELITAERRAGVLSKVAGTADLPDEIRAFLEDVFLAGPTVAMAQALLPIAQNPQARLLCVTMMEDRRAKLPSQYLQAWYRQARAIAGDPASTRSFEENVADWVDERLILTFLGGGNLSNTSVVTLLRTQVYRWAEQASAPRCRNNVMEACGYVVDHPMTDDIQAAVRACLDEPTFSRIVRSSPDRFKAQCAEIEAKLGSPRGMNADSDDAPEQDVPVLSAERIAKMLPSGRQGLARDCDNAQDLHTLLQVLTSGEVYRDPDTFRRLISNEHTDLSDVAAAIPILHHLQGSLEAGQMSRLVSSRLSDPDDPVQSQVRTALIRHWPADVTTGALLTEADRDAIVDAINDLFEKARSRPGSRIERTQFVEAICTLLDATSGRGVSRIPVGVIEMATITDYYHVDGARRISAAYLTYLAEEFGQNLTKWATYETLVSGFEGTAEDLVTAVTTVS